MANLLPSETILRKIETQAVGLEATSMLRIILLKRIVISILGELLNQNLGAAGLPNNPPAPLATP